MRLIVERFCYSKFGAFSEVDLNGYKWYGVEKPWRDNKPSISCIPEGIYYAERYDSPTPGRGTVWQFNDVPGRTHIQIHKGNWESDVIGCIALGKELGAMTKEDSIMPEWAVKSSGSAIKELMNLTAHLDTLTIEVRQYKP